MNARQLLEKLAENWVIKVLSVFFAIALFVFHRVNALEERFLSVPLIIETSGNLIPASSYPRMARVSLKGEPAGIFLILESDIEVYANLSSYTETGAYRVPVQVRKKGSALGIDPLEIWVEPQELALELDRRLSKYVPVSPSFKGAPESGYELVSYTLEPSQLEIDGPQKLVNGVYELATEDIELSGRKDDFSVQSHILNRDPLLVIQGNGVVDIRGFVRALLRQRSFEQVPFSLRGLDPRFERAGHEKTGDLNLEGPRNLLDGYSLPSGAMYLDCSRIDEPGTYTLPVYIDLPSPLTVLSHAPQSVEVEIHNKE